MPDSSTQKINVIFIQIRSSKFTSFLNIVQYVKDANKQTAIAKSAIEAASSRNRNNSIKKLINIYHKHK